MNKPIPFHMRLFNAAFRLPLPFKMKEKLAYSFLPAEKAKELKALSHSMAGSFNAQFGTYEALMEFAPNFARWNTSEETEKIPGGRLVTSGAAAVICDFWTPKEVDLFFAKYIQSTADHEGFCKAMFRLMYHTKEWGYIDENDKPVKLDEAGQKEMRETHWAGMSAFLNEQMPEPKRSQQEWMSILKPLFYPNNEGK